MKIVKLTKGEEAFVDDEDYERVMKHRWHYSCQIQGSKKIGYAASFINGKIVYLHHFIKGQPPKGLVCDHEDRVTTNCQKHNLSFVTRSENQFNKGPRIDNKTGTVGVHYDPKTGWYAMIGKDKRSYKKRCKSEEEAIKARRELELEHYGRPL